ncbi:MAG: hypothetical protein GXP31_11245, partial [Kiritimatiellaeota bacterium]|nr:hypothetical protein [Kiritimatiellota bacterium]
MQLSRTGIVRFGLFAALIAGRPAFAAQPILRRVNNRWELTGTPLAIAWDATTGALREVRLAAAGVRLLENAEKPFDLHTEDGWIRSTRTVRGKQPGALVLDGTWRFNLPGGKPRDIRVPGAWEKQGVTGVLPDSPAPDWLPYNGTAWYRRTFDLPADLRKRDLILVIEQVDDFDWVSINGRPVGRTGEETPEWWAVRRRYKVPAALLKPAGNTIEIKVYDRGGEGGILGSVVLVIPVREKELQTPPIRLENARLESGADGGRVSVVLEYAGSGWTAVERWRVDPVRPFASRAVELTPGPEAGTPKFDEMHLFLGRLAPGLEAAAVIAPYVWPPSRSTVAEFAKGGSIALSCGTAVTGMTVTPVAGAFSLTLGQYWEKDWNIWLAQGRKNAVELRTKYQCRGRVRAGLTIPAGGQFISVVKGGETEGLRALGAAWERLGFRRQPMPDWDRGLALYSLSARGSMGSYMRDLLSPGGKPSGLRNFQRLQLPLLERLGITAIWFLPLWPRGYGVSDYWSIDPATGSADDLRAVVAAAHQAGIRVLGDLIPHGPHASSGLGEEHPEYVARHEDGSFISWWGCLACDYAHPGWQQYMARVAAHWVKTCDLDGWRVDVRPAELETGGRFPAVLVRPVGGTAHNGSVSPGRPGRQAELPVPGRVREPGHARPGTVHLRLERRTLHVRIPRTRSARVGPGFPHLAGPGTTGPSGRGCTGPDAFHGKPRPGPQRLAARPGRGTGRLGPVRIRRRLPADLPRAGSRVRGFLGRGAQNTGHASRTPQRCRRLHRSANDGAASFCLRAHRRPGRHPGGDQFLRTRTESAPQLVEADGDICVCQDTAGGSGSPGALDRTHGVGDRRGPAPLGLVRGGPATGPPGPGRRPPAAAPRTAPGAESARPL